MDGRIGHYLLHHAFLEQANQPAQSLPVDRINPIEQAKHALSDPASRQRFHLLDQRVDLSDEPVPLGIRQKAEQLLIFARRWRQAGRHA